MRIGIKSFMGRTGFELRKKFPRVTSYLYLNIQALLRKKATKRYIEEVMKKPEGMVPLFVNIETINRCNGTCPFCPANVKDETRKLKKMSDALFKKIIKDLEEIDYRGVLALYINNEPFMDERMEKMLAYAKERLPDAVILIFTNGSLLTPKRLQEIEGCFDYMYINNYSDKYEMNDSVKKIYEYVVSHQNDGLPEITIQLRYVHEYLTNRAGTAPNKKNKKKIYKWQCLMPYTDINIFPDGKVGLCCNDTKEITDYGNVSTDHLIEVFRNEKLIKLRKQLMDGRMKNEYCKYCDVVDSGIRLRFIHKNKV